MRALVSGVYGEDELRACNMHQNEVDRYGFRQDLALARLSDAARGGLFGSHRPMNTLAARLLEQPWHRALEYCGYSSSRADFSLVHIPGSFVSVYTSYRAVEQATHDRVTVVFERESPTSGSGQYDIAIRANVSVDSAMLLLQEIAETRRAPTPALITVQRCERHVSVDVRDGWFATAAIDNTVARCARESLNGTLPVVVNLHAMEHLPLEEGARLLLELAGVGPTDEPLRLSCDPEGWRLFRTMVSGSVPLERVLHINSIEHAGADR